MGEYVDHNAEDESLQEGSYHGSSEEEDDKSEDNESKKQAWLFISPAIIKAQRALTCLNW